MKKTMILMILSLVLIAGCISQQGGAERIFPDFDVQLSGNPDLDTNVDLVVDVKIPRLSPDLVKKVKIEVFLPEGIILTQGESVLESEPEPYKELKLENTVKVVEEGDWRVDIRAYNIDSDGEPVSGDTRYIWISVDEKGSSYSFESPGLGSGKFWWDYNSSKTWD